MLQRLFTRVRWDVANRGTGRCGRPAIKCMLVDVGHICDNAATCGASPDCQTYVHCRQACSTGDCFGACRENNNADGNMYLQRVWQTNNCGSACQVGADWGCWAT